MFFTPFVPFTHSHFTSVLFFITNFPLFFYLPFILRFSDHTDLHFISSFENNESFRWALPCPHRCRHFSRRISRLFHLIVIFRILFFHFSLYHFVIVLISWVAVLFVGCSGLGEIRDEMMLPWDNDEWDRAKNGSTVAGPSEHYHFYFLYKRAYQLVETRLKIKWKSKIWNCHFTTTKAQHSSQKFFLRPLEKKPQIFS